jgi:hypothetical protein
LTPSAAAATQGASTFDDELVQQQQQQEQPQKRPKKRVGRCAAIVIPNVTYRLLIDLVDKPQNSQTQVAIAL